MALSSLLKHCIRLATLLLLPLTAIAETSHSQQLQTHWQPLEHAPSIVHFQVNKLNFEIRGLEHLFSNEIKNQTPKAQLFVQEDFVRSTTRTETSFKFQESPTSLVKAAHEKFQLLKSYAGRNINDSLRLSFRAFSSKPSLLIENIADKQNSHFIFKLFESLEVDEEEVMLNFSIKW